MSKQKIVAKYRYEFNDDDLKDLNSKLKRVFGDEFIPIKMSDVVAYIRRGHSGGVIEENGYKALFDVCFEGIVKNELFVESAYIDKYNTREKTIKERVIFRNLS